MIISFYSYKGGVGRSMAMANLAVLFARAGFRVLVVDFDLEAPGLESYLVAGPDRESSFKQLRERPGLLDLLYDYKRRMASKEPSESPFPALDAYLSR